MKKIIKTNLYLLVTMSVVLTACVKSIQDKTPRVSNFSNSSLVQIYQATVNASRNFVYVDANAINGVAMTSGSVFPSGTGTIASSIPSGLKAFLIRDTLSTTTQVPLAFAENMQVGKSYTIFAFDTITTPQQKTVQTNIVIPTDSTARVRFANFVFTRNAVPAVDIFSLKRNANAFTNVQITEVTEFIPYASALNDTLLVRETGTTNLLAQLNGFNPTTKRSYTLVFRGRYQNTTGTVARTLSSFLNY